MTHLWEGVNVVVCVPTELDKTWELGRTYPLDAPTDRPKRAYANCGRQFQPTTERRMLCRQCYRGGTPPRRNC